MNLQPPFGSCNTIFYLKYFISNKKTPPYGVVDFVIFGIENHKIPSHYDLHIKNFNSYELKFLIEYQYKKLSYFPAVPTMPNAPGPP